MPCLHQDPATVGPELRVRPIKVGSCCHQDPTAVGPSVLGLPAQPHPYLLSVAPQPHPSLHPIAGPNWVGSCYQKDPKL
jgi:hypothetical protein